MSKEIAEEYASSLADLTVNSKPLINMLTILAEENIEHAGVIVETVEKHLEKVHADIKLPVLYLIDSIIKNVGGAYTQKFAQIIVNLFTRTFKQVDEKVRAQMFKLRETWHDVFPATKLYQLDVKVNLIDPAWPIQAQPQQSNIHVNPNFLKKPVPTTSTALPEDEDKMRSILAEKEQELLKLQRKKIEMELEQTRRQLELAKKNVKMVTTTVPAVIPTANNVALVSPVVAPLVTAPEVVPVKQRLGPPVNKSASAPRIAPVSGVLATARRDPRLARRVPPAPPAQPAPLAPPTTLAPPPLLPSVTAPAQLPPPHIVPNLFDIKPLERVTKRKNVITIDVRPELRRADPRRADPRRADPRRERRRDDRRNNGDKPPPLDGYMDKLHIADAKKINKLPPIPKINRDEPKDKEAPVTKKKKINSKNEKKKQDVLDRKESSSGSSPEKRSKNVKDVKDKSKEKKKPREQKTAEVEQEPLAPEVVIFKELKNYHKERYMRRNREKSESPEKVPEDKVETTNVETPNVPEVVAELDENKDVDLRVLPVVETSNPAAVSHKRPSAEAVESKTKKSKLDKFDKLFGSEDVDLRQLPQVEEINAPPPPMITDSPKSDLVVDEQPSETVPSPLVSPKKDWNEVKENKDDKKTPSKLDLVRAKLAEATKGKDRLGRPRLFSRTQNTDNERRRTTSTEDADLRGENEDDFDTEDHKKTISIIMSQAKEQFSDGQLDKNQYNALMFQVMQLNEKLKLKEAKQRESLEISKRKLKAHIDEESHNHNSSPKSPNENRFGDIDDRVALAPLPVFENPPEVQSNLQDSDMRVLPMMADSIDCPMQKPPTFRPPGMPMFMGGGPGPYPQPQGPPVWRGQFRPRPEEYGPRRMRGPAPPFYRGKFDKRTRLPFERMPIPPLPAPKIGICQGENPIKPYERVKTPPPMGAPGYIIPPTDFRVLEYIDQDPMKTIQIDGIPREIRFYGDVAVIMLDWDDPREIRFLPGSRRVTFDNKDSVVLSFNDVYKQIEIDDQVFDIKFGAPTRELFINGRWFECFFGGQPLGVIIDGKPRLILLEGPLPQVDIKKEKRTDLVAGKINLIIDGVHMCPIFLDAKPQKFMINGNFYVLRFVDGLRTVLINEQPFEVEFGGLPRPIFLGNSKHFIRFSVLPRNVKPGYIEIANMEGKLMPTIMNPPPALEFPIPMETNDTTLVEKRKTPSPETQGLDMLASLMPSSMAPSSGSEYITSEPIFERPAKIPGLATPSEEKPVLPILGNINVTDLFAQLVATGIVKVNNEVKNEEPEPEKKKEKEEPQPKDDKIAIQPVDLLKSETLKGKQPGVVRALYGGMQCSGCGARFPPEQTVRYSLHLDWHFRQNRRDRDSARRAHSRHWYYDLVDWVQYEEVEDHEEREKSWFETSGAEGESETPVGPVAPEESPSVPAGAPAEQYCALCGDKFDQFYNEDKEEWHLRKAVRYEDQNYHPMCYEDYKASLNKKEQVEQVEQETKETIEIQDQDESIDDDDDDDGSIVEVIEPEVNKDEQPEVIEDDADEADDDDVVLKAEPVEQVVVQDEVDTDDETQAERDERDKQAKIDFSKIKIKQEPIDPDDEPIITAEVEPIRVPVEPLQTTVTSSIDGNLQLDATSSAIPIIPVGGIRINISKSIPSIITRPDDNNMLEDISADDEPLPPGEEPELEYKLKPQLEGIEFSRQPPVRKGEELSGLCSIM